jgi:regulator of protease activity HflC (stomatin/prohibitin superfamily)
MAARGPRIWQSRPRWLKSSRSRAEDAQREAYMRRLRAMVGKGRYEDLVAGRVIINPYLLEDLDRLAEWQRQNGDGENT